jgi:hypothetical protein
MGYKDISRIAGDLSYAQYEEEPVDGPATAAIRDCVRPVEVERNEGAKSRLKGDARERTAHRMNGSTRK